MTIIGSYKFSPVAWHATIFLYILLYQALVSSSYIYGAFSEQVTVSRAFYRKKKKKKKLNTNTHPHTAIYMNDILTLLFW